MKKYNTLIFVIVGMGILLLSRDMIIKSAVTSVAQNITGSPTQIGGLRLSLLNQSIEISDFKMFNPPGFEKDLLVDIPKMQVAWDIQAFFAGKIHLRHLRIHVREVGLAKNKEGQFNVDALKISQNKSSEEHSSQDKMLPIQIDEFELGIGRVVNKNYQGTGAPRIKVYDINLQKTYSNISSVQQLAILVVTEPLRAAGIQGLKVYASSLAAEVLDLPSNAGQFLKNLKNRLK